MKIRKVKFKDLNEIHKLEQSIFNEDAFTLDLIKELINNNTFFFKLERGKIKKDLIGIIIAIKDKADRINVINFFVNPMYQRKGYGSLLLKHVIYNAKQLNEIKKIVLNVNVNNTQAIRLYKSFNFKKVQKIDNYYRCKESCFLLELKIDFLNN